MKHFHLLYGGFTLHARSMDLEVVLHSLESQMHLYVGEFASNRVFIHAGVVGWRGRAILIPGASGTGKSTLVAALLRAGASYYSDEFAVLDDRGLVHPFARPLSIRREDGLPAGRHDPQEFGSQAGVEALPVGLVAVTKYVPRGDWRPRPMTPGQAILALLENTLPAQVDPDGSLPLANGGGFGADVEKHARRRRGNGSAPADDAQRQTTSRGPTQGESRPCFTERNASKLPSASFLDETLLYDHQRHKGHCLNATAALVWRHCDGNTSVEELTRIVAQEMGIAQAAQVVGLALEQLGRRHLLDTARSAIARGQQNLAPRSTQATGHGRRGFADRYDHCHQGGRPGRFRSASPATPATPVAVERCFRRHCADDCGAVLCVVVHDHDYGYSACADSTSSALQNKWPKLSGHRGGPTRHVLRRPDLRRALAGRGHLRRNTNQELCGIALVRSRSQTPVWERTLCKLLFAATK